MLRAAALLAGGLLLAACSTDPRATRLDLLTAGGSALGECDGALSPPLRIRRDNSTMDFVDASSGELRTIIWPFGFAAWLEFGTGVLYASDGMVVGREGDVLDTIGGSVFADGSGFRVCSIGVRTYQ